MPLKTRLANFNIIYFSIVFMLVLFSGVVFFLHKAGNMSASPDFDASIFRTILYFFTPAGVIGAYFAYKNMISSIDSTLPLESKFGKLQGYTLVRSAILEIPGMLGAVCAFLSGDMLFLAFTGIIVLVKIFLRPTPASIIEDLQLSADERRELE